MITKHLRAQEILSAMLELTESATHSAWPGVEVPSRGYGVGRGAGVGRGEEGVGTGVR